MRKSKIIITNIVLLIVVGMVLFALKSNNLKVPKQKTPDYDKFSNFLAEKLEENWTIGPGADEILGCADLDQNAPVNFYRCNLDYLKCFLKRNLSFRSESFVGKVVDEDNLIVEFSDKQKIDYRFKLKKNCHMVYLPKGHYSEGTKQIQENLWDNFHENVYIDKYYVSNSDVKKWKPSIDILKNNQANKTLPLKLKKEFCRDQGKTLLEARYFDAASFLPNRDPNTGYFYKPRTHFKRGRTFLTNNKELSLSHCLKTYVKGCEKIMSFNNFENIALTWTGINYALGGEEEIFINRFDSKRNYKISSMTLVRHSRFHQVGSRIDAKEKKGAFRCMLRL